MRTFITGVVTTILLLNSCVYEDEQILPGIEGKSGDVTVVMDPQLWDRELGDVVRDSFEIFVKGIASPEYKFDVDHVPKDRFTNVHRTDRNIVVFQVNANEEEGIVIRKGGVFAEDQLYILVNAHSYGSLLRIVKKKIGLIRDKIDNKEMARLQRKFRNNHNAAVMKRIIKNHQVRILIPADFNRVRISTDTFTYVMKRSVRRRGVELQTGAKHSGEYPVEEGILVYERPYTSEEDLSKDSIIKARNAFLRAHIREKPLEKGGPYMRTTPDSLFMPFVRKVMFNRSLAVEMHGHWGISDDDGNFYGKGGPFISLSIQDKEAGRIVTVEGFVHSPEFTMREYLRKVEAIIYSTEVGI